MVNRDMFNEIEQNEKLFQKWINKPSGIDAGIKELGV